MCQGGIPIGEKNNCGCEPGSGEKILSREELLTQLKEYKKRLESELVTVNGELESESAAGKGGEKSMSDTKKETRKSGTVDKVVKETKTTDCGCGCVPPPIKK